MKSGSAITFPASSIKFGQSNESWRPITVPVTTPTATVMTNPRVQHLASKI